MKFLKSSWFKFIILLVIIIIISLMFYFKKPSGTNIKTSEVVLGNIESFVEGSGVIKAAEARKIYSKVFGEVVAVEKEEGDKVSSGEVIARLDSKSYKSTLDAQEIALKQANLNLNNIKKQIDDLSIKATADGYVNNLYVSEGSFLPATTEVCSIDQTSTFEIILPFVYQENNDIMVGSEATIIFTSNYSTMIGKVTKVSSMRKLVNESSQVIDVTIEVTTTGYSLNGATARGEILSNGARRVSSSTGTFKSISSNIVRAKTTGTVKQVIAYNGKYVTEGEVIAILENEDLNLSLENASLNLSNMQSQYNVVKDQFDNYTIVSPIDGTITAETIKKGDMIQQGAVISTVSNNDLLEFVIPVDELDIAKLNYDQEVRVTIDANPETESEYILGRIKKLPLEGVSNAGVTEYFVTIEITGNENIRISMSANAKIIISSKQDVLTIPIDAVIKENGINYVEVMLNDGTTEKRKVKLGDRNISYVEVVSGLEKGDEVVIPDLNRYLF